MSNHGLNAAALGWLLFFASTSSWAWSVSESFENQQDNVDCGTFWSDSADSTVSSITAATGSKSCKFAVTAGGTAFGAGFVLPNIMRKNDEAWVRFRIFFPSGFDYGSYSSGNRLKFIRWTTTDSSGGNAGYMDWYINNPGANPPFQATREFDNCTSWNECWQLFGTASNKPNHGVWETYEMYVKFDDKAVDQGGTGRVRAWKNGELIGDLTKRPTMPNSTDTIESIKIFTYWNGGAPKTQHLFLDDLVSTNVTPSARDSHGNPYIGTGNFVSIAPPRPPESIQ